MSENIASCLLDWYAEHARQLPWRGHADPYFVWVSEIMLQQTRVETVIPYFLHWIERFPIVQSLADASEQEVLSAWEGLGYYSRARSLHKAAQIIVKEFASQLPQDVDQLRRLPGIGRYTAGAIASIAFGKDEPALDGNIRRVLARLFNVSEPARSPVGEQRLWELAQTHLPAGQAGNYNQALMDLGAMLCTPRAPNCVNCPLAHLCQAFALGVQEERPVMDKKKPIPHYTVTAAVIQQPTSPQQDYPLQELPVLLARRPSHGLLGGLWEFPGGKLQDGEDLPTCLRREICEELGVDISVGEAFGIYKHAFTHFRITLHAFLCRLEDGTPQPLEASEIRWVKPKDLTAYPMGKIDRQIASRLVLS
jgi:A/G-specific adenine glycosylase